MAIFHHTPYPVLSLFYSGPPGFDTADYRPVIFVYRTGNINK
jgi:hypothetical protein